MRLLICGDRNWTDGAAIIEALRQMERAGGAIELIIEGDARGADKLAGKAAEYFEIPCIKFPALWDIYGRAAGPVRNAQMLKEGQPDVILAFHDYLYKSKGTKNMMQIANKASLQVIHASHVSSGLEHFTTEIYLNYNYYTVTP